MAINRRAGHLVLGKAVMTFKDPDQIAAIKIAIGMHKSGKTIDQIRRKMTKILLDESGKQLGMKFVADQFAKRRYNYKKREQSSGWKALHRKPDAKLDQTLNRRYETLERHFLEKWKDDTPEPEPESESAARDEGFPEGWSRHIGGDEKYYDLWIDRYSKQGVTIWKERGDFWYWQPSDGSERRESFSKFDAISAAEQWLKDFKPR